MKKYRAISVVFLLLVVLSGTTYGGPVLRKKEYSIAVHEANFSAYIPNHKPDAALAYFLRPKSISFVETGGSVYTMADFELMEEDEVRNKAFIDSEVAQNEIRFFRCLYRDKQGEVYKYIDVSVEGKVLEEASVLSRQSSSIEIQRYYENGIVRSRTMYTTKADSTAAKGIAEAPWFEQKLIKWGSEKMYHQNGALLVEKSYKNGVVLDGSYTEYHAGGGMYRTYAIKNNRIEGVYKVFDQSGTLVEEREYTAGNAIRRQRIGEEGRNNKKAFLFGIDNYSPPSGEVWSEFGPKWGNISGAVNDVKLLQKTLVEERGFSPDNITLLTDDKATKKEVLVAFHNFIESLEKGDVAFVHFSGHGQTYSSDTLHPEKVQLVIPCRDVYKARTVAEGYLMQSEIESFLTTLKKVLSSTGQLYLSMDVSHAGYLLDAGEEERASAVQEKVGFRGEDRNMLFNLVKNKGAAAFIFSATAKNEIGYEHRARDGESYGLYSYALSAALSNPLVSTSSDLQQAVTDTVKQLNGRQNPVSLATEARFLFESGSLDHSDRALDLAEIKPLGNSFVLSVGISSYQGSTKELSFRNSSDDAGRYAEFFASQFAGWDKQHKAVLLQNEQATKEGIVAALNLAIDATKPEDYFIFNFSGYCKPVIDSTGKKSTWFVPHGLKDINDDVEIRKKGISLKQLKDLLQLIPANNQLFITEAGSTADFQREFIQALIETSPSIAALSRKNRIFIVPKSSGMDSYFCNNRLKKQGPLNYYLTNLDPSLNIYGLFSEGVYADAIKFSLMKAEADCNYFRAGYFDIFLEKEFVKDLQYFLPEDVLQTRGAALVEQERQAVASALSRQYALVIGNDTYAGKPDWSDLNNPGLDAREVALSLEKNFGYTVSLLYNAPADSIYRHILKYAELLQPSDQLLIYVAGHGDFDERLFDDGFIVCSDSKAVKEDPYRNTYIQYSKLSRMINKLPAQQILMVLDVCFGGTFDERVARNSQRSRLYDDLLAEDFFEEKMKKKTRLYLTSGGKREVPDGYRGKHSPFALRFLDALQTRGGDRKILTAGNLHEYVKMLPSGPLLGSFGDDEAGSEFVMPAK